MDPKQRNALLIGITVLLVAVAWFQFWPLGTKVRQGLDLKGGASVILTAKPANNQPVTEDIMSRAETVILNRVNGFGVSEASVQRQGTNGSSILVQLPGVTDPQAALKALKSTGLLQFIDVTKVKDWSKIDPRAIDAGTATLSPEAYATSGTANAVVLTGAAITGAHTQVNSSTGAPVVIVTFNSDASATWASFTAAHIGQQVAIVLDGVIKSAPVIQSQIAGDTEISGRFTATEATNLAAILQAGSLPVPLVASDTRVVDPTLGAQSLQQGVLAAIAAFIIVALYLAGFYRGFGILSWLSLFAFGSIYLGILATMSQIGQFALSLPGIAGMALTVGLAADTSILMFERVREEVAMGKTVRTAARSGTKHALWTSVDADVVTFVSAIAIFLIAIGPVKGFALTLMIGIVCDLTVGFLFTRPMIQALAETGLAKNPWLFGLKGGEADA